MKKSIIGFLLGLIGSTIGAVGMRWIMQKKVNEEREISDKHLSLFQMMNQWVKIKQEEKNVASYFEKNGYHEIAIYGMSYAGERLVDELTGSSIKIKYAIDRKADNIYADIKVISPEDRLEDVDAVVVTAISFFDEIEKMLSKKLNCTVISLEDILYEI